MPSNVQWNTRALNSLLEGPTGVVAKDLAKRAVRVESAAKNRFQPHPAGANSGIAPGSTSGVGPQTDSGRLASSITWSIGTDEKGLYAKIGSTVEYAASVEYGHLIVRGGRIVGKAPPYPYLRPSLPAASRD